MNFNFELEKTSVFEGVKMSRFLLFSFTAFAKNLFLIICIGFLLVFLVSLVGFVPGYISLKFTAFFLVLYIIFLDLDMFLKFKIKRLGVHINPKESNVAQFLTFSMAQVVDRAIKFCKKKGILISSTSLLYFLAKENEEALIIIARLGIEAQKAEMDAKNYLEKN